MIDDLKLNSFTRVDEKHILDLYKGTDEFSRPTLILISESEPPVISASQIIITTIGKRKDERWAISFTLMDNKFADLFDSFCKDIVDSSRMLSVKNEGAKYICNRYEKWQNMLTKLNGELLSESSIKGLIGELYFLKTYMFPLYGQQKALYSWIGPDKADQDFVYEDNWYEVKAVTSGAESITIASVEQLDVQIPGELIVIYLDRTSNTDKSKITLNAIFLEIYNSLENDSLKDCLTEILLNLGYYQRSEYNEPAYRFSKIDKYLVDNRFPCIRRKNIPEEIINLKYQLSLTLINKTMKKS